MSSTSSLASGASTTATSTQGPPGIMWATTSLKKKDVAPSVLDNWYTEHIQDTLDCPGQGGLFLRYRNLDPAAGPHTDPNVAGARWPFLAIIKLDDIGWLTSPQFKNMPRVSKQFPAEPDGSLGSAFSNLHSGLRGYETLAAIPDPSTATQRARYLVSVQTPNVHAATWAALDKTYTSLPGFRGGKRFKNAGIVFYRPESGTVPEGLVMYEFDGPAPPKLVVDENHATADVWELTVEAGDRSLPL